MRWVAMLAIVLAGCSDDETTPSSTSDPGSTLPPPEACPAGRIGPGDYTYSVMHDGLERHYNLHVPPSAGALEQPLVLNWHGFTSNGGQQAFFSEMNTTADAHDFVVAYPEGQPEGSAVQSFNGGGLCCGDASAMNLDDVGFARAVVADVDNRACIDVRRVYSTGMSNGGFMSHRLACEAADLIVAIGPVAGLLAIDPPDCQPARPIPVIGFYGTEDMLVPYALADDVDNMWAEKNGCTDAPAVSYQQGVVTCTKRSACSEGVDVTFCTVEGGGHCWPGQPFCPPTLGTSTEDIESNEAMWAVFERYILPE